MMKGPGEYRDYPLVDSTVGQRLVLGLVVPAEPLQRRVPSPLQPSHAPPPAYVAALSLNPAVTPNEAPNLLLVFNDLLLNQDKRGQTQADANARYVGYNIPSRHLMTDERGMVHFRIFTSNPRAVPGRYRDALPALVWRKSKVLSEGISTIIDEQWTVQPEIGGFVDLRLTYERGPLVRIVGQQPDFPVWASADTRILRVYQEDMLFEVIRFDAIGVNRVRWISFRHTVPELSDIFTGEERLVSIFGNPYYTRRVFSPWHEDRTPG